MLNRLYRRISRQLQRIFHPSKHSDAIRSDKSRLRDEIRMAKFAINNEEQQRQADAVFAKLETYSEFQKASTLLMYWSMPDELPTHEFIIKWSKSKTILLPVIRGSHMTIRPFTSEEDLAKGSWKTMEPVSTEDYLNNVDIAIVPGVAFDRKKRRLGRGKGYYDKYLKNRSLQKWGIAFDFQLYESIPSASFDIRMDRVITATETII